RTSSVTAFLNSTGCAGVYDGTRARSDVRDPALLGPQNLRRSIIMELKRLGSVREGVRYEHERPRQATAVTGKHFIRSWSDNLWQLNPIFRLYSINDKITATSPKILILHSRDSAP